MAALLFIPLTAAGQTGTCIRKGDALICSGEFPSGMPVVAIDGITTLDLTEVIGRIDQDANHAIWFYSLTGGKLTLIAGDNPDDLSINTSGDEHFGLVGQSRGGASGGRYIIPIDLWVPQGLAGPGGAVTVTNNASIETTGNRAFGVVAENEIGGYHPTVIASLGSFDASAHTYAVVGVNGLASNVGQAIAGDNGGLFTLNADGSYTFDPDGIFDNVPEDQEVSTSVTYLVDVNTGADIWAATLTMTWSYSDKTESWEQIPAVVFDNDTWGFEVGGVDGNTSLFPDMQAYVDALLADAGFGDSPSAALVVINNGEITTRGIEAHGIVAQTVSATGRKGVDGNFWGRIPTKGGPGAPGGRVDVVNEGAIETNADGAAGVVATSRGGTGGRGGEGSTWRYGRAGGEGGAGGDVYVYGSGSIHTVGNNASGIIAISEGGIGGLGGEGVGFTGGALGGHGGDAGSVTIGQTTADSIIPIGMTITTEGIGAYGIWARSIGGSGGRGGDTGWIGTASSGAGGGASDGGFVNIFTNGAITTTKEHSHGIVGQSIGGYGGYGGKAAAMFVAWGGSGGGAGSGGVVTIENFDAGDIATWGDYSHGILAQSIGGGGGAGGSAGGIAAVGGRGGAGGLGGQVGVTNRGSIATMGDISRGVFAQSVGGGGGDGGDGGGFVSVGGGGTGGGNAGNVYVDNWGTITTGIDEDGNIVGGWRSIGVFAQSVGGGGGDGGSTGGIVAVGGSGAVGGKGGLVDVDNYGSIVTGGDSASTIFAQSVGGGGGNGGSSTAGVAAIGGSGGAGNYGGTVNVSNDGMLWSRGHNSAAIFAQSVGGGGGNGGSATALNLIPLPISFGFALGGDGASGGDGGAVTVTNAGTIQTDGSNSHAVMAQSVGGSGGSGGTATTVSVAAAIPGIELPTINAQVTLGGDGASGGDGGNVTVTNKEGEITTTGFRSYGVYAQSVAGSGGDGGNATSVSLTFNPDVTANVTIGGDAGVGGKGGTVNITNGDEEIAESGETSVGLIRTLGDYSTGVFAQSVGGSGGAGGDATKVSVGIDIPLSWGDLIPTPSMDFELTVGGDGGTGGLGGGVFVKNYGSVATEGDFATGVFAQSIGGSGGVGGEARSFDFDLTVNPTDFIAPLADAMSFDTKMIFGGDGGSGNNGGVVDITNVGDIVTEGAFSHGLVAQSVGGSGGAGGSIMTFEFSTTDIIPDYEIPVVDDITGLTNIHMTLEGSGGSGGSGGNVTVESTGDIVTNGDFAVGLTAQSVGGGGGIAGMYNPHGQTDHIGFVDMVGLLLGTDIGVSFTGSLGDAGNAGNVLVNHTGDISTTGLASHGLLAQSAAGIDVTTDNELTGVAGNVDITLDGSVFASGEGAHGIFAQSAGRVGNGNVTITLPGDGTVLGGSGDGAGIAIRDGNSNYVSNDGYVGSTVGLGGWAFDTGIGNEIIDNYGTVSGSLTLGLGANTFNNYGLINSGQLLDVGPGGLLYNDKDIAVGGIGNIHGTMITGTFEQSSTGALWIDLDFGSNTSDWLFIDGYATLDGGLNVLLHDAGSIVPGVHENVIVTGTSGVSGPGLSLSVADSAVVTYEMFSPGETEYALRYDVDFAADGLNGNQMAIGRHFNDIQLAGGSPSMKPLTASIVAQPDLAALGAAYDTLSPHVYTADYMSRLFSALSFERTLHGCPVRDGDYRFSREGNCAWMNVVDRSIEYEADSGALGATDYSTLLSFGLQRAISPRWHAGFGLGFEKTDYDIPRLSERDGTQIQAGGILKGRFGDHAVNLSAVTGGGELRSERTMSAETSGDYVSIGTRDYRFVGAHAGYAYTFAGTRWYVTPGLDLGWTRLSGDGVTEHGAGPAALTVRDTDDDVLTGRADLQLGAEFTTRKDIVWRPYLRASYTELVSGASSEIRGRLAGAPDSVPDFAQYVEMDDHFTNVALGLDVFGREDWVFSIAYDRAFASSWDSAAVFAKLQYNPQM